MATLGRPRKYDDPNEARRLANAKYRAKNKERTAYINKRSACKSFILNLATSEDLDTIADLVEEARHNLVNN